MAGPSRSSSMTSPVMSPPASVQSCGLTITSASQRRSGSRAGLSTSVRRQPAPHHGSERNAFGPRSTWINPAPLLGSHRRVQQRSTATMPPLDTSRTVQTRIDEPQSSLLAGDAAPLQAGALDMLARVDLEEAQQRGIDSRRLEPPQLGQPLARHRARRRDLRSYAQNPASTEPGAVQSVRAGFERCGTPPAPTSPAPAQPRERARYSLTLRREILLSSGWAGSTAKQMTSRSACCQSEGSGVT